jgi:hypothetical protein
LNLVDQFGQLQISTTIDAASASLGASAGTTAAGAARTYQKALKEILTAINDDEQIVLGSAQLERHRIT